MNGLKEPKKNLSYSLDSCDAQFEKAKPLVYSVKQSLPIIGRQCASERLLHIATLSLAVRALSEGLTQVALLDSHSGWLNGLRHCLPRRSPGFDPRAQGRDSPMFKNYS
jgi:hypothetical protein